MVQLFIFARFGILSVRTMLEDDVSYFGDCYGGPRVREGGEANLRISPDVIDVGRLV